MHSVFHLAQCYLIDLRCYRALGEHGRIYHFGIDLSDWSKWGRYWVLALVDVPRSTDADGIMTLWRLPLSISCEITGVSGGIIRIEAGSDEPSIGAPRPRFFMARQKEGSFFS